MSNVETAANIIHRNIAAIGEEFQKKLQRQAVFTYWREIIGEVYFRQVTPIKIANGVLTLYSSNSVIKDQLKYLAYDIIEAIKKKVGEGAVEKIAFGKSFEQPDETIKNIVYAPKKNYFPPNPYELKGELKDITLTEKEFEECKKFSAKVKNPDNYDMALRAYVGVKKLRKLRLKNRWHKCKKCDALCPPSENLCKTCHVVESNKMRAEIRRCFFDIPWKKYSEVQKEVMEKFPYIKNECDLRTIDSERVSLIQQTASRINFGDMTSLDAKFLVMLKKQVSYEQLTEGLIKKTLYELRFDLASQPPLQKKIQLQGVRVC